MAFFSSLLEDYTVDQRKVIDARLRKAEKDVEAGRVHGPFTAKQASDFIERLAIERGAKKTKRHAH